MGFCFAQNIFFVQHKSQNIYIFCRPKREICFQNLTLGYMTKTLNQFIFWKTLADPKFISLTTFQVGKKIKDRKK